MFSMKEMLNEEVMFSNFSKLDSLTVSFNKNLSLIFSPGTLSQVKKITDSIKIKESSSNQNIVAWFDGKTIYLNKNKFYSIPEKNRLNYLYHEFFHFLMKKTSFRNLLNLANQIYRIVVIDTQSDYVKMGHFLVGMSDQTIPKSLINNQEFITYFMNGKIDWAILSPSAQEKIKKLIIGSGLFNTSSSFWKKEGRLGGNDY